MKLVPSAAPDLGPGSADESAGEPVQARAKSLGVAPATVNKWRFLDQLRPFQRPRQKACRRRRVSPTVQLQRMPNGSRKCSGVLSCGSVWSCPVCSQRICSHRAEELKSAVSYWKSAPVRMVTLTVRHALGNDLRRIRKGVAGAWRRLWQGRKAARLREMFHVKHHVRSLEVTHGDNGWHPHLHVLMWQTADAEPGALDYLREQWIAAVEKELGAEHAPDWTHGVVQSEGGPGAYLAKLGLEVTHHHTKSGRRSSRTPWQIALDAIDGDEASAALWRAYCRDMKGARQLTWSKGTRRFFGLGLRDSDAAIVERDDTAEGAVLAEWDGPSWDLCARTEPLWVSTVCNAELWELERLPGWLLAVRVERDPLCDAGLPPADVPF